MYFSLGNLFRIDWKKMVEIGLEFQSNLSHVIQLTVFEGKDLFISACRRHCLCLRENMVCFKQLYFCLKVFPKIQGKNVRKMVCQGQQGKLCKAFLHNFFVSFFFLFILFKLRESLGLRILSNKFLSKFHLLFNVLKLEFPVAPWRSVGHRSANILMECKWEEQPT